MTGEAGQLSHRMAVWPAHCCDYMELAMSDGMCSNGTSTTVVSKVMAFCGLSGIGRLWRLAMCGTLVFLLGIGSVDPAEKSPLSVWELVGRDDAQGYMLTVCDHLRRTLKGKTPVVLYINGELHLVGDVPQQRAAACIDGIFATTPGKAIFARRLYS